MEKPASQTVHRELRYYGRKVVLPCLIQRRYEGRSSKGSSDVTLYLKEITVDGQPVPALKSMSDEFLAKYETQFNLKLTAKTRNNSKDWERGEVYRRGKSLIDVLRSNGFLYLNNRKNH